MISEKWNEICFLLSENIKNDISEYEFEQKVLLALGVLGWKEYFGEIEIRPSFQIGSSKFITPDFVIKNSNKKKLFVIEIKQPNIQITQKFQKQLFSYIRQLKLDYGILIGGGIQVFYDGILNKQEDPILLETIKFERNNPKGETFVLLFSKETFNEDSLKEFTLKSIEKLNRKEEFNNLLNKVLSEDFKKSVIKLIKQNFISEYDAELIDSVLNEVEIEIIRKTLEKKIVPFQSKWPFRENKTGVISGIIDLIREQPKTQDEIVEGLVVLFPERSAESMRNTVKAQLSGQHPLRIEKEKNIEVEVTLTSDNQKQYHLNHSRNKKQVTFIRELISTGIKREELIQTLANEFEKSEKWAFERMRKYERAYGKLGKDDPKLKKDEPQ
jgi:hypothetical protein